MELLLDARKKLSVSLTVVCFVLFFSASLVQADALQDLIDSYSFDYDGSEIDVAGVSDSLVGGFLFFDVNVSSADSGNYVFYVDVEDFGGVVSGSSFENVGFSGEVVRINISTILLSGVDQFNYSLRVYDSGDSLVYREGGFVSGVYPVYDSGYEISGIVDSNVNNDYIEFNLSVNSSVLGVENVTVFVEYGDEVIFLVSEESFGVGINYVVLRFDNESIKAARYDGSYNISRVLIGDKLLVVDYVSSSYDFEDFVKSSYLSGIGSAYVDSDGDGLFDYLGIDFEVDAKTAGTYYVGAHVYDSSGDYLTSVIESADLGVGVWNISSEINGSLIYSLGFDGPYVLGVVSLGFGGNEIDLMRNVSLGGEVSCYDFERPGLSDLEIFVNGSLNGSSSEVDVVVRNGGEVGAFNVVVNVFDDSDYEKEFVVGNLDAGEDRSFSLSFNVSFDGELLVGVVDYDGLIEEENESNNVDFISAEAESIVSFLEVVLLSPGDGYSGVKGSLGFSCSYNGSSKMSSVNLYGDFGGTWGVAQVEDVNNFSGNVFFLVDVSAGDYSWNCEIVDVEGNRGFYSANYSLGISAEGIVDDDSSSSSGGSSHSSSGGGSKGAIVVGESFSSGDDSSGGSDGISLQSAQNVGGDGLNDGIVLGLVFFSFLGVGFWLIRLVF